MFTWFLSKCLFRQYESKVNTQILKFKVFTVYTCKHIYKWPFMYLYDAGLFYVHFYEYIV